MFKGPPEVQCRHCAGPLPDDTGRDGVRRLQRHFCSVRCRLQAANAKPYRQASNRRFPRVRNATRRRIFERDGWRCQLCGGVIDRTLRWPHPGYGVIDHRDPNGPHDESNWQAAHNACNIEKGARVAA